MQITNTLNIQDLHAEIDDKKILNGINLTIKSGEIHAIMGPNGSGKSTLVNVLMGHPKYRITKGSIKFNDIEISQLPTNERANLGLFLAFQYPLEIPGVSLGNFLRLAKNINAKAENKDAKQVGPAEFVGEIKKSTDLLKMDMEFIGRAINEGFSGGEKKRAEIVQMSVLEPKIAMLDEIDSGLDIDALKIVAEGIKANHKKTNAGILLITHYQRILDYITPDFVHVISRGKIIKSGDSNLAKLLEKEGYTNIE
jgi:Fe-S cluster assembly ATP-binding protein